MTEEADQPAPQQLPETITMPLQLFQAALETIGSLPWKQVQPLMAELLKAAQQNQ